jgi:hypothetical protein
MIKQSHAFIVLTALLLSLELVVAGSIFFLTKNAWVLVAAVVIIYLTTPHLQQKIHQWLDLRCFLGE